MAASAKEQLFSVKVAGFSKSFLAVNSLVGCLQDKNNVGQRSRLVSLVLFMVTHLVQESTARSTADVRYQSERVLFSMECAMNFMH